MTIGHNIQIVSIFQRHLSQLLFGVRECAIRIVAEAARLDVPAHLRLVLRVLLPELRVLLIVAVVLLPVVVLVIVVAVVSAAILVVVRRLLLVFVACGVGGAPVVVVDRVTVLLLLGHRLVATSIEVQLFLPMRIGAPYIGAFAVLFPPLTEHGLVVGRLLMQTPLIVVLSNRLIQSAVATAVRLLVMHAASCLLLIVASSVRLRRLAATEHIPLLLSLTV